MRHWAAPLKCSEAIPAVKYKGSFLKLYAFGWEIGLKDIYFFTKLMVNKRKEPAHLIANYKMAYNHVKFTLGF
ncbi:hypothetical protein METH109765_13570 [Mesobacillus thioparans]